MEAWRAASGEEDATRARRRAFRELIAALGQRERADVGAPRGPNPAPAVASDSFFPDRTRWEGHWQACPQSFATLGAAAHAAAENALAELSLAERAVVVLRDVARWNGVEVSELLGLGPDDQRTLLARGRAHVRSSLEELVRGDGGDG